MLSLVLVSLKTRSPTIRLIMPPLLKTLPSSAQHREILVPATRGLKTLETLDCLLPNNHALPRAPSLTTPRRTTTLSLLLVTSHPMTHHYERVTWSSKSAHMLSCMFQSSKTSLKDEINMESKFEWPGNVRPAMHAAWSFKMNMRACARRETGLEG